MERIDSTFARWSSRFSALCFCIALVAIVSSQDVTWTKYSYGAPASTDARFGGMNEYSGRLALTVDSSGNAIATGRVNTGAGMDWVTVKYDPNGNELWRAVVNGSGSIERLSVQVGGQSTAFDDARAVALDSQGNVVVTGHTVADSPGGPRRCTIVKYSPQGVELWRKYPQLPSSGSWVESLCLSVSIDGNDDIVTAGALRNFTSQTAITAGIVTKHNANGELVWENVLASQVSGQNYEANRVAFDVQNNVFVTNYLQTSGASVDGSWVIRKLSSANGTQQWRYDRNNANLDDFALAIDVSNTTPTRVAVVGYESVPASPSSGTRASIVFLEAATGAEIHQRYFGEPGLGAFSQARNVTFHGDDAYVGGFASSQMFGAKINGNYDLVWQTAYSSAAAASFTRAATVSPDGNRFVLVGFAGSYSASSASNNSVVAQFDTATGAIIEAATFVSTEEGRDEAYAVSFAPDGNLFVGGTKSVGFTFTYLLRKFSQAGSPLWTTSLAPGLVTAQLNNSIRIARRLAKTNLLGETYLATWSLIDNDGLHATSLKKLDENGNPSWELRYPNTSNDNSFPRDLMLDSDGNLILVSDRTIAEPSAASPLRSLLVRKFSSAGALLWTVNHNDSPSTASAGRAAAIGSDNSIYVASSMFAEATSGIPSRPPADWVIQKLAGPDGALVWTYHLDGGNNLDDRAMEIAIDGNAIYVAGVVNNGANTSSPFRDDNWRLIKLSDGPTPTLVWSQISPNSGADMVQSMTARVPGDRVYVVGQVSANDGYTSKFAVGSYSTGNAAAPRALFTAQGNDPSSMLNNAMDVVAREGGGAFAVGSLGYTDGASGALLVRVNEAGSEVCRWAQPAPLTGRPGVFNAVAANSAGVVATGMWDAADGSSAFVTVQFNDSCKPMWFSEINAEHTREVGLVVNAITSGALTGRVVSVGYGREPNRPHTAVIQAIDPAPCTLDFDGDGAVNATSDGAIAARAMLSSDRSAEFVSAVRNSNGLRSPSEAANYALTFVGRLDLDLDGDGIVTAQTDGLMLVRAMLGFTGASVTSGAIVGTPLRSDWTAIRAYLSSTCGGNFAD